MLLEITAIQIRPHAVFDAHRKAIKYCRHSYKFDLSHTMFLNGRFPLAMFANDVMRLLQVIFSQNGAWQIVPCHESLVIVESSESTLE